MAPVFNMPFALAVMSIICTGHLYKTADAFPSIHTGSAYSSNTDDVNNNNNNNNDGNNNNNSNGHITIDLPSSPSAQSPTLVTYINDRQFETLRSNNLLEDNDAAPGDTNTLTSDENHIAPSSHNINNNNNNNNNNFIQTFPNIGHVIDDGRFDTLFTNQAALVPTMPSNVQIDNYLKRLPHLVQRQRNRARRIQSFRQAILRGTSSRNSGRRLVGHRVPNMAHARRLALQALRRRMGAY